MSEFVVYHCYDKHDRCLYVGQTQDLAQRMNGHRSTGGWFELVVDVRTDWVETRRDALDEERRLIEALDPIFNDQHSPTPKDARQKRAQAYRRKAQNIECPHCKGSGIDPELAAAFWRHAELRASAAIKRRAKIQENLLKRSGFATWAEFDADQLAKAIAWDEQNAAAS